jgi:hypothetical protein
MVVVFGNLLCENNIVKGNFEGNNIVNATFSPLAHWNPLLWMLSFNIQYFQISTFWFLLGKLQFNLSFASWNLISQQFDNLQYLCCWAMNLTWFSLCNFSKLSKLNLISSFKLMIHNKCHNPLLAKLLKIIYNWLSNVVVEFETINYP